MASEWVESASADNATATATKAGVAGVTHYLDSFVASYDGNKNGALTITDGNWTISVEVFDELDVEFSNPLRAEEGKTITATFAPSGTGGTTGHLNIIGHSV